MSSPLHASLCNSLMPCLLCHCKLQAALVSCIAFTLGAIIPILSGGFIADYK